MYEEINQNINPFLEIIANHWQLLVATYLLIALVGIILGYKQKIVVFENFDDLALSLGLITFPIALSFLAYIDPSFIKGPIGIVFFIIMSVILFIIISKTWRSNNGFSGFLLALLTKIPFAVVYGFSLLNAIAPTGKTFAERSSRRQKSIAGLLFLTPLLVKLVKHKTGVWTPKNIPVSALRTVNFDDDEAIKLADDEEMPDEIDLDMKISIARHFTERELLKIIKAYDIEINSNPTKIEMLEAVVTDEDVDFVKVLDALPLRRQEEIHEEIKKITSIFGAD